MSDLKILITGGLGYLGGRIADFLKRKYPELTIILGTSKEILEVPSWAKSFQIVRLNVCDKTTIDEAISSNLYAIIHLASLNEHESFSNIQFAWEVNALGTQSLLSIANQKQVQKFIYFSTFHVYEDCQKMITEKSPTKTHHPYAATHRAAEDMVRFYHHSQDMDTLTLRLSNGFGYPMDLGVSRWTLVFNDLCRQAVTSGKMIIKSSGKQHRDFICLQDIASAVDHFLYKNVKTWGDGLFNLGGDCSLSIVDVANKICSIYKKKYGSSIPIEIQGKDEETTHNLVKFDINKLKNTGFLLTGNMDHEIERTLSLCESLAK
jgi:UDP-glucose 4-epimerase